MLILRGQKKSYSVKPWTPSEECLMVRLFKFEGMSFKQIALILGRSEKSVEMRLREFMRSLDRKYLKKED